MEWMNRPNRPNGNPGQTVGPNSDVSPVQRNLSGNNNGKKSRKYFSFHNITSVVLLFSLTLLTISVISFIMMYKQNNEQRYVAKDKMQAVFLNGGQVYFGKIRELNNKYVGVTDIYYLRVNQQVQPKEGEQAKQDISLVKLGCELHGPQDQMLINRDQVVFWENLKTDGQVAKAVEDYKKANPGEQKCDTSTNQNNQSGNNGQQQNTNQENSTPVPSN